MKRIRQRSQSPSSKLREQTAVADRDVQETPRLLAAVT